MSIDFAYGRGHLVVDMPEAAEVTVIRKSPLAKIADGRGAVRAALDAPIGAPALVDMARGKRSACILICDITRPVPQSPVPASDGRGFGGRWRAARRDHILSPPACIVPTKVTNCAN